MREAAYNAYRRSSYVLAHSIVSVPSFIVLSFTLAVTNFWAVGLSGGLSGFFFFFVTIFASFWAGTSLMTFISGLVSHQMSAICIGASMLMFFLACSGFLFSRHEIPPYWIWLHYISLIKYPYEGLLINEYGDPAKCFTRGVQLFDSTAYVDLSESMKIKMLQSMSSVLGANFTSSRCFVNGPKILELRGMTDISKWYCLWFTIAWGFFFRVLFYFTLLFGSKNKRI
ncbi:hypothetical protein Q3G72_005799 [Acer saccharum]|nr:hypothetical protein Q3G72_005799 [Acer saccharum]